MSDDVWRREEIASPCIKVCVIHPETRLCAGCRRSIDEIMGWGAMTPEARAAVMADLPAREASPVRRRGGRAGRLTRKP